MPINFVVLLKFTYKEIKLLGVSFYILNIGKIRGNIYFLLAGIFFVSKELQF